MKGPCLDNADTQPMDDAVMQALALPQQSDKAAIVIDDENDQEGVLVSKFSKIHRTKTEF